MADNPDAGADIQLIQKIIHEEVAPVIQHLLGKMQAESDRVGQIEKTVDGIVSGFSEAATGYRRNSLMSSVDMGEDYDSYNGPYKDFNGSDLKEDLIDYILENDISDDELEDILNTVKENAKSSYGKYQVKPNDMAVKIDAGPAAEVAPEAVGEEPEKVEESESKEEPEKEEKPGDKLYKQLLEQHRAARGQKLK